MLHSVDEWLRFRQGDSRLSLIVRTIAGFLWYPVAWLLGFYLVVLIEPGFNPVKAPVSYLAAKFMVPLAVYLTTELNEAFAGARCRCWCRCWSWPSSGRRCGCYRTCLAFCSGR